MSQLTIPPDNDEIEISLFGPGYGECILVHLGAGSWLVVDSCLSRKAKLPAPLVYFNELGVKCESAVELIVVTHWHDDHIRGIGATFEACENATIAISNCLNNDSFKKLVALYENSAIVAKSGVDEFTHIINTLNSRKKRDIRVNPPQLAVQDKCLYSSRLELNEGETVPSSVHALSPSDAAVISSYASFQSILPTANTSPKRVPEPKPNFSSVALWVEVGDIRLLLGADLEETRDSSTGWTAIVNTSTVAIDQAEVFKVPHHGSSNGHCDEVWQKLLVDEPFALVTPFSKLKNPLPTPNDIERIRSFTPSIFLTSDVRSRRTKFRDSVVRKEVAMSTRSIRKVHDGWGQVRLRRRIRDDKAAWKVELFGNARSLKVTE